MVRLVGSIVGGGTLFQETKICHGTPVSRAGAVRIGVRNRWTTLCASGVSSPTPIVYPSNELKFS